MTAASHTIKLQYASNGTATVNIRNAKIIALYQGGFHAAYTAHQTTRQTRTADTYADVSGATLTQTPKAKEHIILVSSLFDNSSATSSGFNKFQEGGADQSEVIEEPDATGETMLFATIYRKTLAASSTTWNIQHKTESVATVGTDEAGIVVLQTGA